MVSKDLKCNPHFPQRTFSLVHKSCNAMFFFLSNGEKGNVWKFGWKLMCSDETGKNVLRSNAKVMLKRNLQRNVACNFTTF